MSFPTVSVCIPTYNGEKYIRMAIESVLAQTYDNFELIIIDDASTDQTTDIVNEFNDVRIRLLHNEENIGMVANWNRCLESTNGRFVKILCHDDILTENCLEECVKTFEKNCDICIVFSATNIINSQGETVMKRRPFAKDRLFNGQEIARKSFRQKNTYGEPSNVMFKKSSSSIVGLFEEQLCYAIDWHYWIMLSLVGQVYYIDKYLASFRITNTSATNSLLKRKKILVIDDNIFIEKCMEAKTLNLHKYDILLHQISIFFRTYAREFFFYRTRG